MDRLRKAAGRTSQAQKTHVSGGTKTTGQDSTDLFIKSYSIKGQKTSKTLGGLVEKVLYKTKTDHREGKQTGLREKTEAIDRIHGGSFLYHKQRTRGRKRETGENEEK